MMYIKYCETGEVVAVSEDKLPGFLPVIKDTDKSALAFFLKKNQSASNVLDETDKNMARVMEDVVNLLVDKGIICFTDLPLAAQQKLAQRKKLRGSHQSINLLSDDENLNI